MAFGVLGSLRPGEWGGVRKAEQGKLVEPGKAFRSESCPAVGKWMHAPPKTYVFACVRVLFSGCSSGMGPVFFLEPVSPGQRHLLLKHPRFSSDSRIV